MRSCVSGELQCIGLLSSSLRMSSLLAIVGYQLYISLVITSAVFNWTS